jgi:hypothetical protein
MKFDDFNDLNTDFIGNDNYFDNFQSNRRVKIVFVLFVVLLGFFEMGVVVFFFFF